MSAHEADAGDLPLGIGGIDLVGGHLFLWKGIGVIYLLSNCSTANVWCQGSRIPQIQTIK